MAQIGQLAPGFNLKNTAFDAVSLESLRGKPVVIAFYPAAFTGVCEAELCTFRDRLAELTALDATVVGVSSDSPFANGVFSKQLNLPFDLLSDPTRSTIEAYGIAFPNFAGVEGYTASQRAVFVVDSAGVLSYAQVCENPGLEPDYDALIAAVSAL